MSVMDHSLNAVLKPQGQSLTASGSTSPTARPWLYSVMHEPFFQFILLGFLIWAGVRYLGPDNNRYTIHVGQAEQQRIAENYRRQYGQWPTSGQLQGLIDQQVREEIFLREGLALRLDKDDEIVRRRIAQKYEFLQTDLAVVDPPTVEDLERWFDQNKLRYRTAERIAFSHVYFSTDDGGEKTARARALKVLEELRQSKVTRAAALGDAFPGPSDVGTLKPTEANRLFGRSQLSQQIFKLPVRRWSGPFRSGYGWHLVYLTGHWPSKLPSLANVHDRVLADYLEEQRREMEARNFEKLRAKYIIRIEGERP